MLIELTVCGELEGDIVEEFDEIERLLKTARNKIFCLSSLHNDDAEEHYYTFLQGAEVLKEVQETDYEHTLVHYCDLRFVLTALSASNEYYIFIRAKDVDEFKTYF